MMLRLWETNRARGWFYPTKVLYFWGPYHNRSKRAYYLDNHTAYIPVGMV